MKTVNVVIKGTVTILYYCSKEILDADDDDFWGNYYRKDVYMTDNDRVVIYNVPDGADNVMDYYDEDIYFGTTTDDEYFHELFSEDCGHPLPVQIRLQHIDNWETWFKIELNDDEEFDQDKVELVLDYEIEDLDGVILADYILYDGKKIARTSESPDVYREKADSILWCYELQ